MPRSIVYAIAAFAACTALGLSMAVQLIITIAGAIVGALGN